jgi:predicted metal-dependent phosphotriesterase family hydrolase
MLIILAGLMQGSFIVPMMLDEGITQEQTDVLMKENPKRFLDDGKPV